MTSTTLLCVCLLAAAAVATVDAAVSYKAAAVDYAPVMDDDLVNRTVALQIINTNLDGLQKLAQQAAAAGAQIVVFPEDSLYGAQFGDQPNPRTRVFPYLEPLPNVTSHMHQVPCKDPAGFSQSPVLTRLSCMALALQVDLVSSIGEVLPCSQATDPNCPADGRYQFNSQVALLADGSYVAKYHKSHLYIGEGQWDQPIIPDSATFTSSFGVRFGMFICFDGFFQEPVLSYLRAGITDLVQSSWWVNLSPLLTATQFQAGFARAHNINLIASGIGLSVYNSGCGVYGGAQGASVSHLNPTYQQESRMVLGTLVSPPAGPRHALPTSIPVVPASNFNMNMSLVLVAPGSPPITASATVGTVTCTARLTPAATTQSGYYAVFAGAGTYNNLFPGQLCTVTYCPTKDASCLQSAGIIASNTTLSSVSLTATFSQTWSVLAMAATTNLVSVDNSHLSLTSNHSMVVQHMPSGVGLVDAAILGLQSA